MGNYLSIAAVTAVLESLINEEVARLAHVGGNVDVRAGRPIDLKGNAVNQNDPAIRIYLYQATPNPNLRNQDLPFRSGDGQRLVQRPRAALDLHYLISFYGDETRWVPQQLLGSVLNLFHQQPILTPAVIERELQNNQTVAGQPANSFLFDSGLSQQPEGIRLTQTTLNLEEQSKLWSILLHIPYALSVTFQASVVMIEPDITPPMPLPVRERQIRVLPFRQPRITAVEPMMLPAGGELKLRGEQLTAVKTNLLLNNQPVELTPENVTPQAITVSLPAELRAGINSIQVQQYINLSSTTTPDWRPSAASNIAAFVLQPTIQLAETAVSAAAGLTLSVQPPVGKAQTAHLLLNNEKEQPDTSEEEFIAMVRLPAPDLTTDENESLHFDLSTVPAGSYFVRLVVDGAQSHLTDDDGNNRMVEIR